MTPLIVGAGGVGLGLASFLASPTCHPFLAVRPGAALLIRQEGIRRTGLFGARLVPAQQVRVVERLADLQDAVPDVICICTKAFDNEALAAQLAAWPLLARRSIPMVLFQNGWGGQLPLVSRFGEARVFSARVITGFIRDALNQVRITVHADAIHSSRRPH